MKNKLDALSRAWADVAQAFSFPDDYEGTPTERAHRAAQAIEIALRDHLCETGDMRGFSLMHLIGQSALSMEYALWPEYRAQLDARIKEAMQVAERIKSGEKEGIQYEVAMAKIRARIEEKQREIK